MISVIDYIGFDLFQGKSVLPPGLREDRSFPNNPALELISCTSSITPLLSRLPLPYSLLALESYFMVTN